MDKNLLNQSIKHLVKDQKLKTLINKYPIPKFSPNENYFEALSKSIIYQQLSGKVAKIIYTRFLSLFKDKIPNPNQYLDITKSDLNVIKNLAFNKGDLIMASGMFAWALYSALLKKKTYEISQISLLEILLNNFTSPIFKGITKLTLPSLTFLSP